MTDYSGAVKACLQLNQTHDDNDAPTLWIRATDGRSPLVIRIIAHSNGIYAASIPQGSSCTEPGGNIYRALLSADRLVVQSRTREVGAVGSLGTDVRVCQEVPGSGIRWGVGSDSNLFSDS
eukprot:934638-Pyramimonas_sp.AAC.1